MKLITEFLKASWKFILCREAIIIIKKETLILKILHFINLNFYIKILFIKIAFIIYKYTYTYIH